MFSIRQRELLRGGLLLLHLVQFQFVLSTCTLLRVLARRLLCNIRVNVIVCVLYWVCMKSRCSGEFMVYSRLQKTVYREKFITYFLHQGRSHARRLYKVVQI